ncbi:hypothetical protein EMCG_06952 [[Emmonsia] crescens]|uniref:Protein kinase domain-containing protein n=1 Tax=[Emmonsia] crescens TaxID=73230 RepID=A0A0G2J673_9EURO|nr:hypothetical protein EMCG_06952 [Emmonsia crescens UAMH 3008]
MASSNVFGDYEALMPMHGLAEIYLGRSMTTERAVLLKVGSTPARIASLLAEEQVLCDLVGVPGVPQLLWSETAPGHTVIATDVYGPTLEAIYDQAGRRLGMDLILSLGEQLLSRLEWIHSRSISHGNLTPQMLAMGGESWQCHQLFITDFQHVKKIDELSAGWPEQQADLQALGEILIYLLGSRGSWDEFQQKGVPKDTEIPAPITAFCECVGRANSQDYFILHRVLRASPLDLGIRFIPRWESDKSSRLFYNDLHLQMEEIGKETSLPIDDAQSLRLLHSLSEVLGLYMNILLQMPMSRQTILPKAYDLPGRL